MLRFFPLLIAISIIARNARAQTAPARRLIVAVHDSTKRPVRGAEVAVVEGINRVTQVTITDSAGYASIRANGSTTQIVVRKIGFKRESRFVPSGRGSADTIPIVLEPAPQTLAAV